MDVEWCECSAVEKNGMMEVGEGKVVGDVKKKKKTVMDNNCYDNDYNGRENMVWVVRVA